MRKQRLGLDFGFDKHFSHSAGVGDENDWGGGLPIEIKHRQNCCSALKSAVRRTVRKRLLNFISAAFHQSPEFVAILKQPIVDRLGEAYDSPEKTDLALQLCWAIGEHGGGGASHKDTARELFERLELLLYENLSSSRLGVGDSVLGSISSTVRRSLQSKLLCFVVTAIAKIATYHREVLPRARVSLGKDELLKIVGQKHPVYGILSSLSMKCSYILFNKDYVKDILLEVDLHKSSGNKLLSQSCMNLLVILASFRPSLLTGKGVLHVLAKAGGAIRDQLGELSSSRLDLLLERIFCLSVLVPTGPSSGSIQKPGMINWSEGRTKMIANIPFYVLGGQEETEDLRGNG
ncbi:unnamed protein product [Lactuca saligna]|uniref:AP-5 complex subunit zeta-1 C-terminal TPR domain-containing protein n=1 Tax=Lactuca saligna TaxID=75948 RepID=A0AA35W057_LACSI|nr:unnamed protein product [Lactuca saligna]